MRVLFLCCVLMIGCTPAATREPASDVAFQVRRAADGSILCTKTIPPRFQDQAGTVEETFKIPNPSTRSVFIDKVHTSCGCTVAALAEKTIAPGSHTSLKMTVDLARRRGPLTFLCKLRATTGETWTCSLLTHLYPRIECSSANFSFGVLEPQQSAEVHGIVSVYSHNKTPLQPTLSVTPPTTGLSVSLGVSNPEDVAPGFAVRRVPITLRRTPQPTLVYGPSSSVLRADVVAQGHRFELVVPVTYSVRSSFELLPPRAFFGQVSRASSPPEKQLIVRRLDTQLFHIKTLTTTNPLFRTNCEKLKNGREWKVHILLDSTRLKHEQRFVFGELDLMTDVHDEPKITVALAAVVQ